eukprot:GHVN01091118.1.p1 GENE.GHVN01091118.1~~GHVN01091118.1.p1  ORF type:complete len:284 (+),score=35.02 GHVN01091118.1:59-853(+)
MIRIPSIISVVVLLMCLTSSFAIDEGSSGIFKKIVNSTSHSSQIKRSAKKCENDVMKHCSKSGMCADYCLGEAKINTLSKYEYEYLSGTKKLVHQNGVKTNPGAMGFSDRELTCLHYCEPQMLEATPHGESKEAVGMCLPTIGHGIDETPLSKNVNDMLLQCIAIKRKAKGRRDINWKSIVTPSLQKVIGGSVQLENVGTMEAPKYESAVSKDLIEMITEIPPSKPFQEFREFKKIASNNTGDSSESKKYKYEVATGHFLRRHA